MQTPAHNILIRSYSTASYYEHTDRVHGQRDLAVSAQEFWAVARERDRPHRFSSFIRTGVLTQEKKNHPQRHQTF